MFKRFTDIIFAFAGLIILLPVFFILILLILADSEGPIFYRQLRIGLGGTEFILYKFRTMYKDADKKGLLTVGMKDSRVTKTGYFLRKYKLDELPQLYNVLKGDMSIVGPRPEVPKYVAKYNEQQLKIVTVRPGLTDYASIEYSNENEILAKSTNPEETYVNEIMPAKLRLNAKYIDEMGPITDLKIIFKTIWKIFRRA
jgi:lipopolysaccharide/colanic/teichoic acid biosynthesis glycosyltransferase